MLKYVSQVQRRTKPKNITTERLTKFWEIKTWKEEEMLWKKPIEKLTCLNRCLHLVTELTYFSLFQCVKKKKTKSWKTKTWKKEETPRKKLIEKVIYLNKCHYFVIQSQRNNAWHLGFVFLAQLVSLSDDYIETYGIYRKKHSCKCYVLLELHKIISMLRRLFDVRVVPNTRPRPQTHRVSPSRPYTFNHEVGVDVFEIVDSVGMRFSIQNAVCMGTTYEQAWIVRRSENLVLRRHMHVYKHSYMPGRVGLVGPSLFAAIEEHSIEAYLFQLLPRLVWRSDLLVWKRQNKSEEWNVEVPCSKKMMSKSSRT